MTEQIVYQLLPHKATGLLKSNSTTADNSQDLMSTHASKLTRPFLTLSACEMEMALPRAYLVVFDHACQQVRSQHLDDMLSSRQGGAVLEGVLYSDGLGRALVLHWRRILHYFFC